jgi:hypothetical protein
MKTLEELKTECPSIYTLIDYSENELSKIISPKRPKEPKLSSVKPTESEIVEYTNYQKVYPKLFEEYKVDFSQYCSQRALIRDITYKYINWFVGLDNIPEKYLESAINFIKRNSDNFNDYYCKLEDFIEIFNI